MHTDSIPLTLDSVTCFQLIAMGLIFWRLFIFKVRTSFDLSFTLSYILSSTLLVITHYTVRSPVATLPRNPSQPFPH
ncbi:hypothetical protein B0H19DRAFT_1274983 [Mycena capillaripes]|nr:hypothetical protein B0H19DRAFT_1274983 [Mycena capillaripes]